MNDGILQFLKRKHSLLVGDRSAEEIKCSVGSAMQLESEVHHSCRGLDLVSSIPKTIVVDSVEIRDALKEGVDAIIDAVRQTLEQTPPELAADILDRGIIMTGGGALLRGLDQRLVEETRLPVIVAEDPLTCVVRGTGRILENIEAYQKVLM
jgi:rod shape-determining protein MreB